MGIEQSDFDEGSAESGISGPAEKPAEKTREKSSSKTLAKIGKTRKDEAKGRKSASLLSGLLAKILRDPRFDPILESVLSLLRNDVPGAYVLGVLSLVSVDAANAIRKECDPSVGMLSEIPPETEAKTFQNDHIRPDMKLRINDWIEDVFRIATNDPSSILTDKFLSSLSKSGEREIFLTATKSVLTFFFASKNVTMPSHEAEALARYLLSELRAKLSELKLEPIE